MVEQRKSSSGGKGGKEACNLIHPFSSDCLSVWKILIYDSDFKAKLVTEVVLYSSSIFHFN